MMDLGQLYQDLVLDHNQNPRNFGKLESCTNQSHGHNPLCGDDFTLYLDVDGQGIIQRVGFEGEGCAISKSSASMMTAAIKGKHINDALSLEKEFVDMITTNEPIDKKSLGKLAVFETVKRFPVRVKCATLIWRTLEAALEDSTKISTE